MANKKKSSGSGRKSANGKAAKGARKTTTVRNSAIPKPAAKRPLAARAQQQSRPAVVVVTYEMIAQRAYEISQSPLCGSEFDNWIRAERDLRGV